MPCNSGQHREQKSLFLCGIRNAVQPSATTDHALVMSRSAVRVRSSALFLSRFCRKNMERRRVRSPMSGSSYCNPFNRKEHQRTVLPDVWFADPLYFVVTTHRVRPPAWRSQQLPRGPPPSESSNPLSPKRAEIASHRILYPLLRTAEARPPNVLQPVLQPSLIRTGTQWTKRQRLTTQKSLNKPDFRTHQYGLARVQANS